MAISKKSSVGVATEATPGTAMTVPTKFLPCKSILKGTRKQEYLNEERGTRDGNYGVLATTREADWNPSGPWYNDVGPYILIAALGQDAISQPDVTHVPTVYKHTITLADIPPSLTVFKSYDAAVYYSAYMVVEKFGLKFSSDGKLLEFNSGLKGVFPIKFVGTYTPTFSTLLPFTGYAPTITLNGSSTTDVDEVSIEFDQKCTMWYPIAGSPDFTKVYFGERTAKVDFTARYDADTFYAANWITPNTAASFNFDVQGQLIANSGGSGTPPNTNYFQELNMTFQQINIDSVEHDLGKDNVLIKVKATAVVGAGPLISAWVQNTIASYAV